MPTLWSAWEYIRSPTTLRTTHRTGYVIYRG